MMKWKDRILEKFATQKIYLKNIYLASNLGVVRKLERQMRRRYIFPNQNGIKIDVQNLKIIKNNDSQNFQK